MDDDELDIHALIEDINGNHRESQEHKPQPPHLGLVSDTYHSKTGSFIGSGQGTTSRTSQQSLYVVQAADQYNHSSQDYLENSGLDVFDGALLAESRFQGLPQSSSGFNVPSAGRLSLPSHTAAFSQMGVIVERKPWTKPRANPTPPFASQMDQNMRTPPVQTQPYSSPPPNVFHSSPLFAANQGRAGVSAQSSTSNTKATISANDGSHSRSPSSTKKILLPHPSLLSPPNRGSRLQPQFPLEHPLPIVQGVQIVSLNELPDRLRSVFVHPLFNAIQSKCFASVYKSNDNLVVSAPTGGGKTAILELAICRLLSSNQDDQFKIVYMAPTKSLCSERQRDWQPKFAPLNLLCAELTGDTDYGQLRNVQSASIVITTPEKWDSMTRKWKDHAKLMQMVKLFLIDEVHILKEMRGATLEAVVSRMKSVGSNVRFVALSATIPNSIDIATWLGKNASNQDVSARQEKFGEEFRPVKLQRHVVGLCYKGNDFGFETYCDPKLPGIIAKYSHKKPIMVFCITRKVAVTTAKLLATFWASQEPRDRQWEGPNQRIVVHDPELKQILTSAVAFHHAGLDGRDRTAVEKGFLEGQVNVICCTSTLAVGVNLPCHMVIIKNTVSYQDDGIKEYADLEIMQMLGRAGRPQFDTSAVAVIITKQEKVKRYEKLVSGEEVLESCLHLNLIDHLNAEIGLGTISDLYTAKRWLSGTFLYVRLVQNPEHYKLDGDVNGQKLEDRIEHICRRDLSLLEDAQLIKSSNSKVKATEYGDAMARYYIKFETMQIFMRLQHGAKISDILSTVAQADEFRDIRLKAHEKKLFKELNQRNGIKYPIKVDLAQHAHKRSLIIQAELGGVEYPIANAYAKHKKQFNQDKAILFSHVHRLIRCIIDCQIHSQDALTARHALELARSFGARVWDNSPYQMKQLAQIGLVAIRKLVIGGINSIEALEAAEPHRIEMLMSKNPPFGSKLLASINDFPKLRVSVKMMGTEIRQGRNVTIKFKAECGFMNDKPPTLFHQKPIYVCLLTERSDGYLVDFKRVSANKLKNSQDYFMSADMLTPLQYITCYVMCDEIAGTIRSAQLMPNLPDSLFPTAPKVLAKTSKTDLSAYKQIDQDRIGDREVSVAHASPLTLEGDEYAEDGLNDQDMMEAVLTADFDDIDDVIAPKIPRKPVELVVAANQSLWIPEMLRNGKWACNHKCKDKTACKHMCCREGIDKVPKPPKSSYFSTTPCAGSSSMVDKLVNNALVLQNNSHAGTSISCRGRNSDIEMIDLTNRRDRYAKTGPSDFRKLDKLHQSINSAKLAPLMRRKKPVFDHLDKELSRATLLCQGPTTAESSEQAFMDYEDDLMTDLPSPSALFGGTGECESNLPSPHSVECRNEEASNMGNKIFPGYHPLDDLSLQRSDGDDQEDLEAAMIGMSDSVVLSTEISQARAQTANDVLPRKEVITDEHESHNIASLPVTCRTLNRDDISATSPPHTTTEKLFLSTDSPEKAIEVPAKRTVAFAFGQEEPARAVTSQAPVPKKSRSGTQPQLALQTVSIVKDEARPPIPSIRLGHPAWVYECDPALIAEFQDFVDFV